MTVPCKLQLGVKITERKGLVKVIHTPDSLCRKLKSNVNPKPYAKCVINHITCLQSTRSVEKRKEERKVLKFIASWDPLFPIMKKSQAKTKCFQLFISSNTAESSRKRCIRNGYVRIVKKSWKTWKSFTKSGLRPVSVPARTDALKITVAVLL